MANYRYLIVISAVVSLSCSAWASGIVVTVNGVTLPDAAVNQALTAGGGKLENPATQAALNNLVNQELLVQVAIAEKLNQSEHVQQSVEAAFRQQMAAAAFQAYLAKNPITEQDLRTRYEDLLGQLPEEEVRIRHIQFKTREEALAVLTALQTGESFSNLARRSSDVQTADRGGELGWQNSQTLLPVIFAQIRSLDDGQVTGPVETPSGWEVVQLLEKRPMTPPSFDVSRPQIQTQLNNEALQRYLVELRGKAKIVASAGPN